MNSRSGEQKDLSSCMLLWLLPWVVNHEVYTTTLPREVFISLLVRCMEKLSGWTDSDNISRERHFSAKQRMLQSLMSLWKATLARISSTLLSRDWTLANSILGSGGRCARLRSLTRWPLRLPLLRHRCFGSTTGIRSIVLGGGANRGSAPDLKVRLDYQIQIPSRRIRIKNVSFEKPNSNT
jgi:hypothetical protein